MTDVEFVRYCKQAVVDYFNSQVDSTDKNGKITEDHVFIVWSCKTLQNWKALLSTTIPDGMYYEFTYDGNVGLAYLDAYKKWKTVVIPNMNTSQEDPHPIHG